jgi:hypothetical protein
MKHIPSVRKSAHLHADKMKLYAQDAAETEKPWLRWEFHTDDDTRSCIHHPGWADEFIYTRKPRDQWPKQTVTILGVEVPKPLSASELDAIPSNSTVHCVNKESLKRFTAYLWRGLNITDYYIFATSADAETFRVNILNALNEEIQKALT